MSTSSNDAESADSFQRVHTAGPDETRAFARDLAALCADGDLLVLAGDLGAGKTCFTQGFGVGLGIDERITSPTFTIHSRYEGRLVLNHLDVYRIEQLEDTLDLDLPELLESGVTVIEWGEQLDPILPSDHLVVRIRFGAGDDDRVLALETAGPIWTKRLQEAPTLSAWWSPC